MTMKKWPLVLVLALLCGCERDRLHNGQVPPSLPFVNPPDRNVLLTQHVRSNPVISPLGSLECGVDGLLVSGCTVAVSSPTPTYCSAITTDTTKTCYYSCSGNTVTTTNPQSQSYTDLFYAITYNH